MTLSVALAPARAARWLSASEYPFQARHARLADGTLHYIDEGVGEPIVFVHGTPTWSFEFRHLIRSLRHSHRCLALDHLGFGLSERPAHADYSPEAHAARFAAWMDQLGLERCTLVVHDFGGPIALPWAAQHPERVARVVLFNTWLWSFEDEPAMARRARLAGGFLGRLLYRYLNASLRLLMPSAYGDRKRLTADIHRHYLSPFPDPDSREHVLHALARSLWQSRAHFAALWEQRQPLTQLPMLIVWGLADGVLPPAYLARLGAAFPRAELCALEGVGHWPHEEAPERVLEVLARFVSATAETTAPAPPAPARHRAGAA